MTPTPLPPRGMATTPSPMTQKVMATMNEIAKRGGGAAEMLGYAAATSWEKALRKWHTQDKEMLALKDKVRKLSIHNENYPILITGPTGTGKELIARAFEKPGAPFIAVNCGGLSKELVPSIFFGHVKGAFTGANENRDGILRSAKDGVVFLDEIAELPMEVQAVLLRAIQENEIYQVGNPIPTVIQCRFIAATKHDLRSLVVSGRFRDDLFARLYTFELGVSGLDERRDDINHIADHAFNWKEPITDESALADILKFNVRGIQSYVARMKVYGRYK